MKTLKIYLAFTLLMGFAIPNIGYSQYWKTNGNFVNPGDFLGSINHQDLRIRVSNIQRMRIMSNTGFLGLGNFSFTPNAFLHINQMTYHNYNGNLIRTDGNDGLDLNWSMFSGSNIGNSNKKAQFLLSPNTLTQGTGDRLSRAKRYYGQPSCSISRTKRRNNPASIAD